MNTKILENKSMRRDRILIKAMRPGYTPLRGTRAKQVVEPSYAERKEKVGRRVSF
jgi:hypothetical protein